MKTNIDLLTEQLYYFANDLRWRQGKHEVADFIVWWRSNRWGNHDDQPHCIVNSYVSPDAPTKITYQKVPGGKWVTTSWTKYLRIIGPRWKNWSDEFLEVVQAELTTYFGAMTSDWHFDLVRNYDVTDTYYDEQYGESCMLFNEAVDFYSDNPQAVGLLRIEDVEGNPYGRALVWNTDQGTTVLDRIYPSDGGRHVVAAIAYAQRQGWELADYLDEARTVSVRDTGNYPWLDTFYFATCPNTKGEFKLSNRALLGHHYRVRSEYNTNPFEE